MFEKALAQPVSNWNMTQDKFLFQEDENIPEVFLICLNPDKQPQVFKCQLPGDLAENRHQTVPTLNIRKFVIEQRNSPKNSANFESSFMKQATN